MKFPTAFLKKLAVCAIILGISLSVFAAQQSNARRPQDARVIIWLKSALDWGVKKEYDKAIENATQALQYDVNDPEIYAIRGRFYLLKSSVQAAAINLELALSDLNQAIRLNPNVAGYFQTRSSVFLFKNQHAQVVTDLTQAIRLDASVAAYYLSRAYSYSRLKNFDAAIADYSEGIKRKPTDEQAYINRGGCYFQKGDSAKAIADYSTVIQMNPRNAEAWAKRADVYFKGGLLDQADSDIDESLRLNPNDVLAKSTKTLINSERTMRKVNATLAAAEKNPPANDAKPSPSNSKPAETAKPAELKPLSNSTLTDEGYTKLGSERLAKKEFDAAISAYTDAIKLNPNKAEAFAGRGNAYVFKGEYDRAIADLTEALRLNMNYSWAYATRGGAYFMKSQYDRALSDLSSAIKINPKFVWAYKRRAETLRKLGSPDLAELDEKKVKELEPQ